MKADLPEGFRLQEYERVESTNTLALEAARNGEPGNLWIIGRQQTAGRGRRGRRWASPPGNLYASLMLIDAAESGAGNTISFVAALALDRALSDLIGPAGAARIALKWPNDVLCDGKKVAGILVEGGEVAGHPVTVIGMGVNCRSHPEIDGPILAGDMASMGFDVEPKALLSRLSYRMAEALAIWDRGADFATIRQAWLARAAGVGAGVRVAMTGVEAEGAFETVDSLGRMVVRLADGSRTAISAGDASIRFARGGG